MTESNDQTTEATLQQRIVEIEQNIVDVINNERSSADISKSIAAAETLQADLAARIEQLRDRCLDLINCDDATAQATMVDVERLEMSRSRLALGLEKARMQLNAAHLAESKRRFDQQYTAAKEQQDQLAVEFATTYQQAVNSLLQLFQLASAVQAECNRVNSLAAATDGEFRRFPGPELVARGMAGFTRSTPSVLEVLQLVDLKGEVMWPPRRPSLAASFAETMLPQHHPGQFTADWWKVCFGVGSQHDRRGGPII